MLKISIWYTLLETWIQWDLSKIYLYVSFSAHFESVQVGARIC
jgi:hypothetical protein